MEWVVCEYLYRGAHNCGTLMKVLISLDATTGVYYFLFNNEISRCTKWVREWLGQGRMRSLDLAKTTTKRGAE
jgi:hypothetical protein